MFRLSTDEKDDVALLFKMFREEIVRRVKSTLLVNKEDYFIETTLLEYYFLILIFSYNKKLLLYEASYGVC